MDTRALKDSPASPGLRAGLTSTLVGVLVITASLASSVAFGAEAPAREPDKVVVKKSQAGICHSPTSPSYDQVTYFQPFESVNDCVASGGRLPKGTDKEVDSLPVRKSRKGICHDASSSNYATMKYFDAFKDMDACVTSGGRPRK